jgi:hypothetical protein
MSLKLNSHRKNNLTSRKSNSRKLKPKLNSNNNLVRIGDQSVDSIYDTFMREYDMSLREFIPYLNIDILMRIINFTSELLPEITSEYSDNPLFKKEQETFLEGKEKSESLKRESILYAVVHMINNDNELNVKIRKKIYLGMITDILNPRYSGYGNVLNINYDTDITPIINEFKKKINSKELLRTYNFNKIKDIFKNGTENNNNPVKKINILLKELNKKVNIFGLDSTLHLEDNRQYKKILSVFKYQEINQLKLKKIIKDSLISKNIKTDNINIWYSCSHAGLSSEISNVGIKKNPPNSIIIFTTPINKIIFQEHIWSTDFFDKINQIITAESSENIYCIIKKILNYTFLADASIILPNQTYFDSILSTTDTDSPNNFISLTGLTRFTKESSTKTFYGLNHEYLLSSIVEQISHKNKDIYNIIVVNCCRTCNNELHPFLTEKIYITENFFNMLNNIILNQGCGKALTELEFQISLTNKNNRTHTHNHTLLLNKTQSSIKNIFHKYQHLLLKEKYEQLFDLLKNISTKKITYSKIYHLYMFCYNLNKIKKEILVINIKYNKYHIMSYFLKFIISYIKDIENVDQILLILLQGDYNFNLLYTKKLDSIELLLLIEKLTPIINSIQITNKIYENINLYSFLTNTSSEYEILHPKNNHIIISFYNIIFQNIDRSSKLIDTDLENFQMKLFELLLFIINLKINTELINLFINFKLLQPINDSTNLLSILGKVYKNFDITNLRRDNSFVKEYIENIFYDDLKNIIIAFTTNFPDWKTSDMYINWLKTQTE